MPFLRDSGGPRARLGQGLNYPIDDGLHLDPLLVTVGTRLPPSSAQRVHPPNAVK
jgi:hypothetical protein